MLQPEKEDFFRPFTEDWSLSQETQLLSTGKAFEQKYSKYYSSSVGLLVMEKKVMYVPEIRYGKNIGPGERSIGIVCCQLGNLEKYFCGPHFLYLYNENSELNCF
jgi:hypothetical protein